jgi:hypothetical protein
VKKYAHSNEIYDDGLAIAVFGMESPKRTYRHRNEYFTVPREHDNHDVMIVDMVIRVATVDSLRKHNEA